MNETTVLLEGHVYRYQPKDRHCREGLAVAKVIGDRVVLQDTFWGSGMDAHVLRSDEAEAAEFVFDKGDFRQMERRESPPWASYHPDDRAVITSQHGLQRSEFIRIGATPHLGTQIENAEAKVAECTREVASAEGRLEWARAELDELKAGAEA